ASASRRLRPPLRSIQRHWRPNCAASVVGDRAAPDGAAAALVPDRDGRGEVAARRERVPGEPEREEPQRIEPAQEAPRESPRRGPVAGAYAAPVPWWVVLLQGIVGVLVGLALLVTPAIATMALVQLVGLYWFVAGIFALV